jgi:hypothetical protein
MSQTDARGRRTRRVETSDVQARAQAEEGPVEAPGEPVDDVEDGDGWPEAAAHPGDGERLARVRAEVGHLTDVGSLEKVLGWVVEQAVKSRVRPEVIQAVVSQEPR